MAKTAIDVVEEKAGWMQRRIFHGTKVYIMEHIDSCPVKGAGLPLVRDAAAKKIGAEMEEELLPQMENHLDTQMAAVERIAGAAEREQLAEEWRSKLLATDPVWNAIPSGSRASVEDEVFQANWKACTRAAEWVEQAGGEEFEDYTAMVRFLGKTPDEAVREMKEMMDYVELMERHSDDLDISGYSPMLESEQMQDWFLDRLVEGLKKSEGEALETMREDLHR